MSINRVIISGHLTRDAELRALPSGAPVLSFGVAVNERRKNQQTGEWEDRPNFVDCTMFGTRAKAVSRYLQKGSKVAIGGRLRYSSWENEGQKRSKLDVIVDELEFMSRREEQHVPQPNYGPMDVPSAPPAPQNVVQATPQVQSMVNDTFSNAGLFNSPYPGGNFPERQEQPPALYDEDIPF